MSCRVRLLRHVALGSLLLLASASIAEAQSDSSEASSPESASSASWGTSFEADILSSQFETEGWRFVAVAADGKPSSRRAAEALEAALNETKARTVLERASLEDEVGSEDEAILEALADRAADRFILIRTFQESPSKPPRAVVTIYNAAGDTVAGFSARKGETPRADEETREADEKKPDGDKSEANANQKETRASKGVSQETSETIAEVTEQETENRKEALETFRRKFLWVEGITLVNVDTGAVGELAYMRRGEQGKRLSGEQFYKIVGREKLASQYKRRQTTRTLLIVGGTVGAIGTGALVFAGLRTSRSTTPASSTDRGWYIGAGVLGAVSVGVTWAGNQLNPHPVSISERRKMAQDYNNQLKKDLDLTSDTSSGSMPDRPSEEMEYDVGVHLHPRGGAEARFRLRF